MPVVNIPNSFGELKECGPETTSPSSEPRRMSKEEVQDFIEANSSTTQPLKGIKAKKKKKTY